MVDERRLVRQSGFMSNVATVQEVLDGRKESRILFNDPFDFRNKSNFLLRVVGPLDDDRDELIEQRVVREVRCAFEGRRVG